MARADDIVSVVSSPCSNRARWVNSQDSREPGVGKGPSNREAGTNSTDAPVAGHREWLGLAVLALSALMLSVDISVLFLALPHLSADLEPSITQQLSISDIYGFMIAGFLVTMGTLGDRIGRRRLLLIGAAAF